MTLTEQIAAVLAEHSPRTRSDVMDGCGCGWTVEGRSPTLREFAAHQAARLAPLVRQAQAGAWDEGHRTGWGHCQDGNYGTDYWDDDTPNPYRADRIEAEA